MKQNKETLKEFFETGDKPTQEQYSDLIDSYVDSQQETGEANRRFVIDENGDVNVTDELKIPEYTLSEIVNNKIALLKDGVTIQEIDLTSYINDTNLARLISGTVDENGLATFTRDDDSTFTVDFSSVISKLSFSDNGDGTYTFNNGDDSLTINTSTNESLTTLDLNDDNLNYVDENGNTSNINLSKYVNNDETYSNLSLARNNSVIVLQEKGVSIDTVSLSDFISYNSGLTQDLKVNLRDIVWNDTAGNVYAGIEFGTGGFNFYTAQGQYMQISGSGSDNDILLVNRPSFFTKKVDFSEQVNINDVIKLKNIDLTTITPIRGMIALDNTDNDLKFYNGTNWISLTN